MAGTSAESLALVIFMDEHKTIDELCVEEHEGDMKPPQLYRRIRCADPGDAWCIRCRGNQMKPPALTPHQFGAIHAAAQSLPPSQREDFIMAVKRRLGHAPSDIAVQIANDSELSINRLPNFIAK
jgi:hypothetical protein